MKTHANAVVVARTDLTPALRQRLSFDPAVLVFSAGDAGQALSMAVHRGLPRVIALDRYFVSSPAGARFVTEVRSLSADSEIRVLEDEGSHIPLLLRRPVLGTGRETIAATSHPLRGVMRRAPRYPLPSGHEAIVNGAPTALVNLSVSGAQLVAPSVLKPTQTVGVTLLDESQELKLKGAIAWSVFERSRKTGQTCYRAGLEFADAEPGRLEAYCAKYGIEL